MTIVLLSHLWMSPVVSVSGYRYYVLFIDDYTRYSWIFPMRLKSEVFGHFSTFAMYVKTQFSLSIKQFQSDGGKEYDNLQFKQFCATNGIVHHFSCLHTHQQNGLAQRKHRHIADMGRTLLHTAHMPHNLWVEAFCMAVSLINRLPTPVLKGVSLYKLLFGISPDYVFLRVLAVFVTLTLEIMSLTNYNLVLFSVFLLATVIAIMVTAAFILLQSPWAFFLAHQLSPFLLSIPRNQPSPHLGPLPLPLFPSTLALHKQLPYLLHNHPYRTHHQSYVLQPQQTAAPFFTPLPSSPLLQHCHLIPSSALSSPTPSDCLPLLSQPSVSISSPSPCSSSPPVPVNVPVVAPPPLPARPSPVHTRSKSGIVKPNPKYHANFSTRIKRRSDGTIERYKARLVAKGFHQQSGADYFDTFSPVVKRTTVRTVLCLAISFGWPLRQLDVKNAFLHGSLSEDVYMRQPPGFVDPHQPDHVCKLNKAIYGLKQAPWAWFQHFSQFLLRVGFTQSQADNSMFVYHDQFSVMILLLYVDDIILTGSNSSHLLAFLRTLGTEFDIKDLGHLNYFLGVEVHYHPTSIHLTQNKYTVDLLKRSNLLDCKLISTPMTSKGTLSRTHGTLLADPTPYRQMVGALQYLTMTRPDIFYAVHFEAVKQILHYLKGTLGVGLLVRKSPDCSFLVTYSDADWAACPDTRRSTTGYCVFLGPNLISWSAKKQPTVSRSSAEAEYRALAYACADTLWIQGLLTELHCPLTRPVLLHCDNLSATYLAANPVFHARTKHIDIDYHFIRERVASGSHKVQFIPSHLQLADVFTKGLPTDCFARLVSKLVTYPVSSLRGNIR
ncbi:hypothetical protein L3X38_011766 [Prunus dulcis]|uniref:Integrase catalytic domain-containing protein n=1 Tax=Prunus dulcis TaxID=3755 RepID=A0AAD4WI66_PRUDU|nr:hypothetical protein L3X38_011766 [Prunus dulcis]